LIGIYGTTNGGSVIDCENNAPHFNAQPDSTLFLAVDSITFRNGKSDTGGGCITSTNKIFVSNSVFDNCQSGGDGGAILAAYAQITNSAFQSCISSNNGGALSLDSSVIMDSNFTNNQASEGNGGALVNQQSINLARCKFTGNSAGVSGGAIYIPATDVSLGNLVFTDNSAGGNGGALYIAGYYATTYPSISQSNFFSNKATMGGGIYLENSEVSIAEITLIGNIAAISGGGIFLANGTIGSNYMQSISITNNYATTPGAGLYAVVTQLENGLHYWFEKIGNSQIFNNTNTNHSHSEVSDNVACNGVLCPQYCPSPTCNDCGGVCVYNLNNPANIQCLGGNNIDCGKHGSCVFKGGSTQCLCTDDYEGFVCDQAPIPAEDYKKYYYVAGGIILFTFIIFLISMALKRSRRKSREETEYAPILPRSKK